MLTHSFKEVCRPRLSTLAFIFIILLNYLSLTRQSSSQHNDFSKSSAIHTQKDIHTKTSSFSSLFSSSPFSLASPEDESSSSAVELGGNSDGILDQQKSHVRSGPKSVTEALDQHKSLVLSRSKRSTDSNSSHTSTPQSCSSNSSETEGIGKTRYSQALAQIEGLETASFYMEGDIMLGAFVWMYSRSGTQCVPDTSGTDALLTTQAINLAIKAVNSDPDILPGIKVGFVQIPTCGIPNRSLAQALSFLPRVQTVSSPSCSAQDDANNTSTHSNEDKKDKSPAPMPYYDVIGMLGPPTSDEAVGVSRLLGSAHIPVVGVTATSDALSDKTHHPYFLRVVAADKNQVEAMLTFITDNGWSFISVVYLLGPYGEAAYDHIKSLSAELDVCIAASFGINLIDYNTDEVARGLLQRGRARVVILFVYSSVARRLLRSVDKYNATGHFVWIASDAWTPERRNSNKGLERQSVGTFSVKYQAQHTPDLYRHIANVMLGANVEDPAPANNDGGSYNKCPKDDEVAASSARIERYLKERAWNSVLQDCSNLNSDELPEAPHCLHRQNATMKSILSKFDISATYSLTFDAVMTFIYAAHKLISDHCPGAKGLTARQCIRGDLLLQYMKQLSFNGSSGVVRFDSAGDAKGRYLIKQIVMGPKEDVLGICLNDSQDIGLNAKTVAYYDIETRRIELTQHPITWDHLNRVDSIRREYYLRRDGNDARFGNDDVDEYYNEESIKDRFLYNDLDYSDLEDGSVPESVCSRPCNPGEFLILREPAPCCWECRRCRDNERVARSNTSCVTCAEFTWPDPNTDFRSCAVIPVTYPRIYELLPTLQIFLGGLAIAVSLVIVSCFVYFRESRVIKAASRELSVLQIAATFVGFMTVIIFQMAPSAFICGALYFLFCLSFALLYCPLLVKAVRIYRIFNSTTKSTRRPRFVSPVSQIIMTACLVSVQVILCIYVFFVYQPSAQKIQPALTEKYVELSCDMTLPGLTSFLAYNLVLVFLCSLFAFKTRKLPDNFNESNFICMCVSTTLVIWLAFVPTYFTSERGRVRVLLLSLALLLNHTVALVFLFAPKIYAAIFVAEENFVVTRFQPGPSTRFNTSARFNSVTDGEIRVSATIASGLQNNNRVAPMPQSVSPSPGF